MFWDTVILGALPTGDKKKFHFPPKSPPQVHPPGRACLTGPGNEHPVPGAHTLRTRPVVTCSSPGGKGSYNGLCTPNRGWRQTYLGDHPILFAYQPIQKYFKVVYKHEQSGQHTIKRNENNVSWGARIFWVGGGERFTTVQWSLTSSFPPHSFPPLLVLCDSSSLIKETKDPHMAEFIGKSVPLLTETTSTISQNWSLSPPWKICASLSPLCFSSSLALPSFSDYLSSFSFLKLECPRVQFLEPFSIYPPHWETSFCFTVLNTMPHAHYSQNVIVSPNSSLKLQTPLANCPLSISTQITNISNSKLSKTELLAC